MNLLSLIGIQGRIGLYWNIALWIPNIIAPAPLVLIIGIFDLVIAAYVATVATLQSGYLPHASSGCRDAETWQVPNDTLSFFHLAGSLNATQISAEDSCKHFVKEWKFSIVAA